MTRTCPVCGDVVEHVRVEEGPDQPDDTAAGGTATFDIDDLCSVEDETRWDRVCTAATAGEGGTGPTLEVYYHFFGEET